MMMAPLNYNSPSVQHQSGYILIFSVIFLFMMVIYSTHFFYRATESTIISGSDRDSKKALLLAESAMEYLRGVFISNRLDSDATIRVAGCKDAAGKTFDMCEAGLLQQNMSSPDNFLFTYMYYVSNGTGLDLSKPSLLQRVVDGEASQVTAATLNSQKIDGATAYLRVNDLFSTTFEPRLYKTNDNGRLVASVAKDWNDEIYHEKAAAWMEVIQNPVNSDAVDLIVQTVAQVGKAKSYMQRYVGTLRKTNALGSVGLLSEASNIDRAN
jgi:Tfp pilus assembly protein PilX